MTDERLILAIGRLDRALTRLEEARGRTAAATSSDPALAALKARHQRLRDDTSTAIDRLTRLIDVPVAS